TLGLSRLLEFSPVGRDTTSQAVPRALVRPGRRESREDHGIVVVRRPVVSARTARLAPAPSLLVLRQEAVDGTEAEAVREVYAGALVEPRHTEHRPRVDDGAVLQVDQSVNLGSHHAAASSPAIAGAPTKTPTHPEGILNDSY